MTTLRSSLLWKLTLAFVLVALTTAGLMAVLIRLTSVDRLAKLIIDQQRSSLQTTLTEYYAENGSWNGVAENWQQFRARSLSTAFAPTSQPRPGRQFDGGLFPPQARDRRRLFGLADAQGKVVVPLDPEDPAGQPAPEALMKDGVALVVDGKRVGTLLVVNSLPGLNPEESLYLQRTNEALLYAVLGALVIALAMGVFLASTLIRPLRALTEASQNIARGQLDQQVTVRSRDEIGQLAEAFNRMSQEVVQANQLRQQMTADIAHDLRTPLTVIAGYVESMRDGVLKPTSERLSTIYTEIERLQNLVGDLRMLSQMDAGELPLHPQSITPRQLLERAAAPFEHRAETQHITLSVLAEESLPAVRVDEARMMQVFGNLLSNALRYTPEGGKIELLARRENGADHSGSAQPERVQDGRGQNGRSYPERVILTVLDSGAGIPEGDLPYIFNRFYRSDKARSGDSGETGLGLAIVKALVEAHGGTVRAESKPGEGTAISISLPVSSG